MKSFSPESDERSNMSNESPEISPEVSPEVSPEMGVGSLMLRVPEGMEIPEEGTITVKFKKAPSESEEGEEGMVELVVESVDDVVSSSPEVADESREATFDRIAKQVRSKKASVDDEDQASITA